MWPLESITRSDRLVSDRGTTAYRTFGMALDWTLPRSFRPERREINMLVSSEESITRKVTKIIRGLPKSGPKRYESDSWDLFNVGPINWMHAAGTSRIDSMV